MSTASLTLPEVIDSASVSGLRGALLEHRGQDLNVDASLVRRIGGLGLQVLISAARTWEADGHSLRLESPSPAFTDILRLTGAAVLPEFVA
jgi:chemotaxis protein CheX